jgi:hypothetical protein
MTRTEILDLYFLQARANLIDLAAFLDRLERATGKDDFRVNALSEALIHLKPSGGGRVESVLRTLSDPTSEPIVAATTKAASGAWAGQS